MKLLLHCCCAPCSVSCIRSLRAEQTEPHLFWYNPNIHPYTEYKSRKDCLNEFAKSEKLALTSVEEYGLREFLKEVYSQTDGTAQKLRINHKPHEPVPSVLTRTKTRYVQKFRSVRVVRGKKIFLDSSPPQRCKKCYRMRLEKTASFAKQEGFSAFSTTLLISPYQDHEEIKRQGEKTAEKYGVEFLYRDFRPLFREGQTNARAANMYMQKYCGCVFSEEERYLEKSE
jgi:epoxyqueuosine reductase